MPPTSPTKVRDVETTTLPNGIRIVSEYMPHVRSVSMGVWVATGARDEPLPLNGISHFVEHMVFKGTTSRSTKQIARDVDTIGGAFTMRIRLTTDCALT